MSSRNDGEGRGAVGKLNTKFQGISFTLDEPEYQPPAKATASAINCKLLWHAKSKSGSFESPYPDLAERKKNCGTLGAPVRLYTNHFNIKLENLETIFLYDVVFIIESRQSLIAKKDYPLLYRAYEELKKTFQKAFGDPRKSVLDAPKNIYSAMQLNLKSKNEFEVTIPETPDIPELTVTIKAVIKPTTMIPVIQGIRNFIFDRLGRMNQPTDVNSCFNIVLGYSARILKGFDTVGRSIFTPQRGVHELSNGKSVWFGTFCSTRMGWEIRLNVDMVCKPAYNEDSVVAFACKFCGCQDKNLAQSLKDDRILTALSKELNGLKVRFRRPDNQVRDSKVVKVMPGNAKSTMFNNFEGPSGKPVKVSVFDFFKESYGFTLKKPELPVVQVGNKQKTIYWPMELLSLKSQSCPVSKAIFGNQAEQIIKISAKFPKDRKLTIENGLHSLNNCFKTDNYVNSFGLEVDGRMIIINGRVLPSPRLSYPIRGIDKETIPANGKWKLTQGSEFNVSKPLKNWGVLNLSSLEDIHLKGFLQRLTQEGKLYGMKISPPASVMRAGYFELAQKFEEVFVRAKRDATKPDLIIVIINEKDNNVYSNVKHLGEVVCHIPTQVLLKRSVLKDEATLMHNVCLKINSKLGGTNQRISKSNLPAVLKRPVMFIGADVTHSTVMDGKPSIAAVVGSMDARASIYHCLVRVQERESGKSEERILKMEDMVRELLKKFYDANNGRKPEKIIFYRDGVSEGQFEEVMNCEISAVQRACKSIQADGYEPGITLVLVQKRHHTRFFPAEAGKSVKSGNVLPGTVVDQEIVHPRQQAFYLASHEGLQGTTKPVHYSLLFDDNNFSANELQQLTYYLCHLYSRCEQSVSYPAPTYYAHLSAFRARHHHNVLIQNNLAHDLTEIQKLENLNIPNYFL